MKIEVTNTQGKILNRLNIDQLSIISSICSFKVENDEFKQNMFKKKHRGSEWDGYKRLFDKRYQTFPIGLLGRITRLLDAVNIKYEIINKRTYMGRYNDEIVCKPIEVRDYQNRAVLASMLNGNGIIKAATGSGKTTIACMTACAFNKPSVFIVHTKDLLYQTISEWERLTKSKIGQIGDGIIDIQLLTIATVQTLARTIDCYEKYSFDEDYVDEDEQLLNKLDIMKWAKTVGLVQFDEVQRVANRTAFAVRYMFENANNAFGYSASPWRDDGCDLMIEAAFGERICDISASELIKLGYLIKPEIIIKTINNNIWSGNNYNTIYRTAIVENQFRNIQIVQDAISLYNDGRTVLVLVTQLKHGKTLENMIKSMGVQAEFISGKSKMSDRKRVIKEMRDGKAKLIIATTIADVGLDVPRISGIVEAGAGKSSVTALQRVGRGIRKFDGKTDLIYITYRDNVPIIYNHIDNKIKIWREEPEFIIREE